MTGKYLYGIIKRTPRMVARQRPRLLRGGLNKIDGLSTVDFRSLSALITDAEYRDYNHLAKEEVVKELTGHQQKIEEIMENLGAVLPVKFGTILKNDDQIREVLEKGYSLLVDSLQKMADKIELDLVCFWNEQKAAQMAFQESKKVRTFSKKTSSLEDKIALGKLVAQYLETKRERLSRQILRVLKKETVASCDHALADVNMILNQAFLVKKDNEEGFNHTVNILDSQLADLINFRLVGPLPPYSFATVVVEALEPEEVNKAKKLLGLNGQLNLARIKKAYDQLAFRLHPDYGGDPVEFEQVTKSYQLLRKFAEQGLVGVYLYRWEGL